MSKNNLTLCINNYIKHVLLIIRISAKQNYFFNIRFQFSLKTGLDFSLTKLDEKKLKIRKNGKREILQFELISFSTKL
jgi:hypothetical protein